MNTVKTIKYKIGLRAVAAMTAHTLISIIDNDIGWKIGRAKLSERMIKEMNCAFQWP